MADILKTGASILGAGAKLIGRTAMASLKNESLITAAASPFIKTNDAPLIEPPASLFQSNSKGTLLNSFDGIVPIKEPILATADFQPQKIQGDNLIKSLEQIHSGITVYMNTINQNTVKTFNYIRDVSRQQTIQITNLRKDIDSVKKEQRNITETVEKIDYRIRNIEAKRTQGTQDDKEGFASPNKSNQTGSGSLLAGLLGGAISTAATAAEVVGGTAAAVAATKRVVPWLARRASPWAGRLGRFLGPAAIAAEAGYDIYNIHKDIASGKHELTETYEEFHAKASGRRRNQSLLRQFEQDEANDAEKYGTGPNPYAADRARNNAKQQPKGAIIDPWQTPYEIPPEQNYDTGNVRSFTLKDINTSFDLGLTPKKSYRQTLKAMHDQVFDPNAERLEPERMLREENAHASDKYELKRSEIIFEASSDITFTALREFKAKAKTITLEADRIILDAAIIDFPQRGSTEKMAKGGTDINNLQTRSNIGEGSESNVGGNGLPGVGTSPGGMNLFGSPGGRRTGSGGGNQSLNPVLNQPKNQDFGPPTSSFSNQSFGPGNTFQPGSAIYKDKSRTAGGIDRSGFQAELDADPSLIDRLGSMVKGEVGMGTSPAAREKQLLQLETVFNRSQIRNHSLAQGLWTVDQHGNKGYYPPSTFSRPMTPEEREYFVNNTLKQVLAGSDLGTKYFGAPVTGNASAKVGADSEAKDRAAGIGGGWVGEGRFREYYTTGHGNARESLGGQNLARIQTEQKPNRNVEIIKTKPDTGQVEASLFDPNQTKMPSFLTAKNVNTGPVRNQADRPGHIGGDLTMNGQHYLFGSGSGNPNHPSIPYGTYSINTDDSQIGSIGHRIGSVATLNATKGGSWGSIPDTKIGRTREGIQLHASSGSTIDSILTEGCIGIPKSQWPQFKAQLLEQIKKNGPMYLTVGPEGAKIEPYSGQPTTTPDDFIKTVKTVQKNVDVATLGDPKIGGSPSPDLLTSKSIGETNTFGPKKEAMVDPWQTPMPRIKTDRSMFGQRHSSNWVDPLSQIGTKESKIVTFSDPKAQELFPELKDQSTRDNLNGISRWRPTDQGGPAIAINDDLKGIDRYMTPYHESGHMGSKTLFGTTPELTMSRLKLGNSFGYEELRQRLVDRDRLLKMPSAQRGADWQERMKTTESFISQISGEGLYEYTGEAQNRINNTLNYNKLLEAEARKQLATIKVQQAINPNQLTSNEQHEVAKQLKEATEAPGISDKIGIAEQKAEAVKPRIKPEEESVGKVGSKSASSQNDIPKTAHHPEKEAGRPGSPMGRGGAEPDPDYISI